MLNQTHKANIMRLSRWFICLLSIIALWTTSSIAQVVTLLDPNGDGGFENGSTFAANNWIVAGGPAVNNQWFVGSVPGTASPFAGSNCAYPSENAFGSTLTYNTGSASTVYFYRDIVFPAGKTRITLTMNWKGVGEAFLDRSFICYTDPANTPVNNDVISSTPPSYVKRGLPPKFRRVSKLAKLLVLLLEKRRVAQVRQTMETDCKCQQFPRGQARKAGQSQSPVQNTRARFSNHPPFFCSKKNVLSDIPDRLQHFPCRVF